MLVLREGAWDVIFKQVRVLLEKSLRPTLTQSVQLILIYINIVISDAIYLCLVVFLLLVIARRQVLTRKIPAFFVDDPLNEFTILSVRH
jgi:hypothetical protein